MSVSYSAVFLANGTQVGTTTGQTSGIDIQEEMNDVANYFRGNTLGVSTLGVQNWDTLNITANSQQYSFNR